MNLRTGPAGREHLVGKETHGATGPQAFFCLVSLHGCISYSVKCLKPKAGAPRQAVVSAAGCSRLREVHCVPLIGFYQCLCSVLGLASQRGLTRGICTAPHVFLLALSSGLSAGSSEMLTHP